MIQLDRRSLLAFASPVAATGVGPLYGVLAPLREVSALPPLVEFARLEREARLQRVEESVKASPERRLAVVKRPRVAMDDVFVNYERCLAWEWVRWLSWAQWVYDQVLPIDFPGLRAAVDALIAVESQLQVSAAHPNRDHVVHPIADAELAVALYRHARGRDPTFDDDDWNLLVAQIPELAAHASERGTITACGLALAGMFHDVGYLRYIGERERSSLATLGIAAPAASIDLWSTADAFAETYLDKILGEDGRFGDLFDYAWHKGWHGPLGGFVLANAAAALRTEGRLTVQLDAAFAIASAAAALHELHDVKKPKSRPPAIIAAAHSSIAPYAWPLLFRVVDELQCWMRFEHVPSKLYDDKMVADPGAQGCEISPAGDVKIWLSPTSDRGVAEAASLEYLRTTTGVEARLGLRSFTTGT